jgi:predicted thioredoxin/glutaredoxin
VMDEFSVLISRTYFCGLTKVNHTIILLYRKLFVNIYLHKKCSSSNIIVLALAELKEL